MYFAESFPCRSLLSSTKRGMQDISLYMQMWGPNYATSGSLTSTNPFSFLVVNYHTLYLMVIPPALRRAIWTPLHRRFPMDLDEFNWSITLYLIKGEYYYCNFPLIKNKLRTFNHATILISLECFLKERS